MIVLRLPLFLLRFCGQGMCSHIAMTAMGRWFEARRGQAVSITTLGHPAGEIVMPLLVVAPLLSRLLAEGREPVGQAARILRPGLLGRQWQRRDAARHWLLPALLPVLLTPGFITTFIFFHQAHIAQVKGWTLVEMAPGHTAFGLSTVVAAFAEGWAADRFGALQLLPGLLVPMGLGVALIAPSDSVTGCYVALAVVGPGITGILIDGGIGFPARAAVTGAWCAVMALWCWMITLRVQRDLDPA